MIAPRSTAHGVRLFEGDSLAIVPQMIDAGERFRAIVTDPPYSSGGMFRGDRAVAPLKKYLPDEYHARYSGKGFSGDTMDQWAFYHHALVWLSQLRALADERAVLLCFIDWRQLPILSNAIQAAGWIWRGIIPWNKTGAARPQKGYYRAQCEYILHATAGSLGGEQERGDELPCAEGFFTYPVTHKDKFHPTGKPTCLMRDLLQIFVSGERVLDTFAGSGTTGIAAAEMGIEATLIEKDAHNCEVIEQRLGNLRAELGGLQS